jgi:hypothetical protein
MTKRRILAGSIGALMIGGLVLANYGGEGNHTLRWDQNLPAATRFVILAAFNSDAVLDKETGLVWEKAPQTETATWNSARFACTGNTTGGRKGWRLPSVHELNSLVDPSVAFPGPTLPPGHPFLIVQSALYWSATTLAEDPRYACFVDFGSGGVSTLFKSRSFRVWCVRGGHNDGSEY